MEQIIPLSVIMAVTANQIIKWAFSGKRNALWAYGGFPSSHAAFTAALAASIGLASGLGSTFWLAAGFFGLTTYDAVRLRRQHGPADIAAGTLIGALMAALLFVLLI